MLLVTQLVNVRYLTGYSGTNGLALVGPGTRTFITDFRYVEQAAEQVDPSYERLQASEDLLTQVAGALAPGGHCGSDSRRRMSRCGPTPAFASCSPSGSSWSGSAAWWSACARSRSPRRSS